MSICIHTVGLMYGKEVRKNEKIGMLAAHSLNT